MLFLKRFFAIAFAFFVVNKIKRSFSKAPELQKKTLKSLIKKSKNTSFGIEHKFHLIKNHEDFVKRVPVRDYEQIKKYIARIKKGELNVLWPGKPKYLAKEIFKILQWPESTEILICPQDVSGNRKPDPSSLLKAAAIGGFSPEESIYVGDSWRDSEAANNAKMDFLFANYGYGKESSIKKENLKGVIQKPLEILEFLS